ncbi:unnamed protein product, partial [Prorocentrum cordatum]
AHPDGKIFFEAPLEAVSERLVLIGLVERVFLCLRDESLDEAHPLFRDGPNYGLLQAWLRDAKWEGAVAAFEALELSHGGGRLARRTWSVTTKRQGAKGSPARLYDRLLIPGIQQSAREVLQSRLGHLGYSHAHCPGMMVTIYVTSILAYIALPILQRRVRQGYFPHKGLHHSICWGLAKTAQLEPGQLVVDPMAGKGVILLEAAAYWPSCRYLAGEADSDQLSKAAENLAYATARGVLREGAKGIGLLWADCRRLPLPSASVDVVLCDLPWGRQFGEEESNTPLYRELLIEVARVLRRQKGRALLFTMSTAGNDKAMSAAIDASDLCLVRNVRFRFGGNHNRLPCTLYCLAHPPLQGASRAGAAALEGLFDWSCFERCQHRSSSSVAQAERSGAESTDFVFQDVKPLLEFYLPGPSAEAEGATARGEVGGGSRNPSTGQPQPALSREGACFALHLCREEYARALCFYRMRHLAPATKVPKSAPMGRKRAAGWPLVVWPARSRDSPTRAA